MRNWIAAFIRHGDYHQRPDTPSAWQPYPLNDAGKAQASQAGNELLQFIQKEQLDLCPVIDSSSLLRAWQTADIITKKLSDTLSMKSLSIESHTSLGERCVGSAANLSIEEIQNIITNDPRYPELPDNWKSDSHYQLPLPGAESLLQAGERVARHVSASMQALERNTAITSGRGLKLFVGHGAAFRHAAYHLKLLPFHKIATLSMYHARPVYFTYQASGFKHYAGAWKVRKAHHTFTD